MKQIISTLLLVLVLSNCYGQATGKKAKKNTTNAVQKEPAIKTQYDSTFVAGLAAVFEKPYKLMPDYILVGQDTVYPPEHLPKNKEIIFQGNNSALVLQGLADDRKEYFILVLKSISYTNFTYRLLQITNDSIAVSLKEGTAVLFPGLVLSKDDDRPNYLHFFPRYTDDSDSSSVQFMFNGRDEELNNLRLDLRIEYKRKEEYYSEKNISFSEVKFVTKEK